MATFGKTKIEEIANASGKSIDGMQFKVSIIDRGYAYCQEALKMSQTRVQIGS